MICFVQKRAMRTIHDVLNRLRAEFLEMPGLRLTSPQVQRLCGVERTTCQMVLDALVNEGFLWVTPEGLYVRRTTGQHHPATASRTTSTAGTNRRAS
jgi:hypothetical protein